MNTDPAPDHFPPKTVVSIESPEPAKPAANAPDAMGFWKCLREIYRFAFSSVFGLVAIEVVLILAVLGVIGGGFGAFNVVWSESKESFYRRDLFWNGFGVGLFHLSIAYMVYLHYARSRKHAFYGWDRAYLYLGKAALPFAMVVLPAALPGLFSSGDKPTNLWNADLLLARWPFPVGLAFAVAVFAGLVELVTWFSTARHTFAESFAEKMNNDDSWQRRLAGWFRWVGPRLRGLDPIEKKDYDKQADTLFCGVIMVYAGLVGYTMVDSFAAIDAWLARWIFASLVVLAFLMVRYPMRGLIPTVGFIFVAWVLRPDDVGPTNSALTATWPWVNAPLALLVIRGVFQVWYLARNETDKAGGWGITIVLCAGAGILAFVYSHAYRVGAGWDWGYVFAPVYLGLVLWFVVSGLKGPEGHRSVAYAAAAVFWALVGGLLGWLVGAFNGVRGGTVLPAAMSVCLLLAVVATAYSLLRTYAENWFYPTCLAVLGGVILLGSIRPYPHRIEELAPEYKKPFEYNWKSPADSKFNIGRYLEDRRQVGSGQLVEADVFAAWRARHPAKAAPPLVIVTCAGGASVSAIFCYNALVELERAIPNFHRHVRIVTGASGGMVGAAYYRAMLQRYFELKRIDDETGTKNLAGVELAEFLAKHKSALTADFLSPIVQGLAFKDVPMALACPFGYWDDRGRRLERAWQKYADDALEMTFDKLKAREATGEFPSLIFSPMVVEDGRPLLISTLDLDRMAVPKNPVNEALRLMNIQYKIPEAVPVRAYELMKMFPDTGWRMRLGTAARLNSSFPFFSPGASLPTVPPRRLVDAGYLENYGMAVAMSWVLRNHEVNLLKPNARRVVVIELRPWGSWTNATLTAAEHEEARKHGGGLIGRVAPFVNPFQEFSTPLEGLFSSRTAGMNARNSDQFESVQKLLGTDENKENYLVSVPFKGELPVPLNWTLTGTELERIDEEVNAIFPKLQKPSTGKLTQNQIQNRSQLAYLEKLMK